MLPSWNISSFTRPCLRKGLRSGQLTCGTYRHCCRTRRHGSSLDTASRLRAPASPFAEILPLARALLRECTYLPDPVARRWVKAQVLHRFSKAIDNWKHYEYMDQPDKHQQNELQTRLKPARAALKLLKKANAGHENPLTTVLDYSYGRRGRRRWMLIRELAGSPRFDALPPVMTHAEIRAETPLLSNLPSSWREKVQQVKAQRHQDLDAVEAASPNRPKWSNETLIWHQVRLDANEFIKMKNPFSPAMRALMRALLSRKTVVLNSKPIKNIYPAIPKVNAWGRPMPRCRVRNARTRWCLEALERTIPPLPESEWDQLHALVTGAKTVQLPVPRRTPAISSNSNSNSNGSGAGTSEVNSDDLTGIYYRRGSGTSRPRVLTQRTMRRHWATILSRCPKMKRTAVPGEVGERRWKWDVVWADVANEKEIGLAARVHATDGRLMGMFEGVDANGRILKERS